VEDVQATGTIAEHSSHGLVLAHHQSAEGRLERGRATGISAEL
jgi:hypothetical protein